jgi:signal peptidase I
VGRAASLLSPARAADPASRSSRRWLFDYAQAAVVALIFALFVRTYLFQVFKIPSASMEDTLLVGDHLVVNKFSLAPLQRPWEKSVLPLAEVKRGDIVIFRYPHDPRQDYIKRVIGLPGDSLKIVNQVVWVRPSGAAGYTALAEPYTVHKYPGGVPDSLNNYGPVDVPYGQYFMMGDNRDDSLDSREWGFVPRRFIVGRPLVIYWSFDGIGPDGEIQLAPGDDTGARRVIDSLTAIFRLTRWERSGRMVR